MQMLEAVISIRDKHRRSRQESSDAVVCVTLKHIVMQCLMGQLQPMRVGKTQQHLKEEDGGPSLRRKNPETQKSARKSVNSKFDSRTSLTTLTPDPQHFAQRKPVFNSRRIDFYTTFITPA